MCLAAPRGQIQELATDAHRWTRLKMRLRFCAAETEEREGGERPRLEFLDADPGTRDPAIMNPLFYFQLLDRSPFLRSGTEAMRSAGPLSPLLIGRPRGH